MSENRLKIGVLQRVGQFLLNFHVKEEVPHIFARIDRPMW